MFVFFKENLHQITQCYFLKTLMMRPLCCCFKANCLSGMTDNNLMIFKNNVRILNNYVKDNEKRLKQKLIKC